MIFSLALILPTAACLVDPDTGRAEDSLPWVPGSTTIAVMPDTERYSDDYPQYFEAQTKWIAENDKKRNIACAVHLGDITQHNAPTEWEVAKRCFQMLDGRVPYVLLPGNHDYDDNAPKRETSRLSDYFQLSAIQKWPTFGGVYQAGKLDNSFHLVRIGDRDWIIVALECGPRNEVVEWANQVLERHADRLAIITTHAYLFRNNVRYDHTKGSQRASPHGWGNDGEELWQKLVRRHPNTMIVLSGHVSTGGLGYLASEADYGNTVHQMMVDYEKMRGGGQAFMRLLEFLPDGKTVQVRTYSPALKQTRRSELEEFTFPLKLADRKTPRPVSELPSAELSKSPTHRYSFDGAGKRIREDVLEDKRAEYGEQIVQALSAQLAAEYGRGFSRRNLFNMIRFSEVFPDGEIVQALSAQLSWTHFVSILPLDDPLKREFYAEMLRQSSNSSPGASLGPAAKDTHE